MNFDAMRLKSAWPIFKSKAAKTWIGNYNYLVIPRELYLKQSLYEWKEQIPYYVGIIVVNVERRSKWVAKKTCTNGSICRNEVYVKTESNQNFILSK